MRNGGDVRWDKDWDPEEDRKVGDCTCSNPIKHWVGLPLHLTELALQAQQLLGGQWPATTDTTKVSLGVGLDSSLVYDIERRRKI